MSSLWGMIGTGNFILRTKVLEYFNNSLYFKSNFLVKFGFYPDTKIVLKMAIFLGFGGFGSPLNQNF